MSEKESSFNKWYADPKNKKALAERRKQKYHSDPSYREKALKAAADYRQKQQQKGPQLEPQYKFNAAQTADMLGVSTAVLRGWLVKSYYPEPKQYQGKLMFTQAQVDLLQKLKTIMEKFKYRVRSDQQKAEVQGVCNAIYVNW